MNENVSLAACLCTLTLQGLSQIYPNSKELLGLPGSFQGVSGAYTGGGEQKSQRQELFMNVCAHSKHFCP